MVGVGDSQWLISVRVRVRMPVSVNGKRLRKDKGKRIKDSRIMNYKLGVRREERNA